MAGADPPHTAQEMARGGKRAREADAQPQLRDDDEAGPSNDRPAEPAAEQPPQQPQRARREAMADVARR